MVPEKLKEFILEHKDPDYQSTISKDIPIERQELSEETRGFLATLYITYWAENPEERRRMVEKLRNNDRQENGKSACPMTDEEYHESLQMLAPWHEQFGPIPFWEESLKSHTSPGYENGIN